VAKKLTGVRLLIVAGALATATSAVWWIQRDAVAPAQNPATTPSRGGVLVGSVRTEPRSFNRLVARDRTSNLVSLLLHDRLVRVNFSTQVLEPALADRWEAAPDGVTWTLHLRPGVVFSDGQPFTSADVLFSLDAVYDEATASPLGGSLEVGGKRLTMTAPDSLTVVVTLPEPFGPGLRILDNLPVFPRHRLQSALEQGTLREVWGPATPASELAGLGPFVLKEYRAGERLTFVRNPHYWRRDPSGAALPYIDELTLLVVPDHSAELLRLEAGDVDLISGEVTPEDLSAVHRAADQGRLALHEVGVGLDPDFLWFNLRSDSGLPRWLQSRELRQAISSAVDRQGLVDAVYLGAGVPVAGPVTPGNHEWFEPSLAPGPQNVSEARRLLAAAGLTDRDGDGQLETPEGKPARFSLLTQKGHSIRERSVAFIQQDLASVGLGVDVVTLEGPALIERITAGRYEAAYFGTQLSDTDPATNLDFWLSSGAFHPWNPAQAVPATPWERRIDELMLQHARSADPVERKRLFVDVQRILQDEMPAIYFAAPRVTVATSLRVKGVRPGLLQPFVLWDAALLSVGS